MSLKMANKNKIGGMAPERGPSRGRGANNSIPPPPSPSIPSTPAEALLAILHVCVRAIFNFLSYIFLLFNPHSIDCTKSVVIFCSNFPQVEQLEAHWHWHCSASLRRHRLTTRNEKRQPEWKKKREKNVRFSRLRLTDGSSGKVSFHARTHALTKWTSDGIE